MKCNSCGTEIPTGSGFCPKCGSMVSIMSANNMPMQNTVDGAGNNGIKKSGGNNNLIIVFAALVMILVVVLIAVFLTGKDRDDKAKEDVKTEQSEAVAEQETEVVLSEDQKEELAVEVAEEFMNKVFLGPCQRMFKISSIQDAYEIVNDLKDYLSSRYPREVAENISNKMSDYFAIDSLTEDDIESLQEDEEGALFFEELRIITKTEGIEELDEVDLQELEEEMEKEIAQDISELEWGYRIAVKMTIEVSYIPQDEENRYYYVAYADGKCGLYAMEYQGEKVLVTDLNFEW